MKLPRLITRRRLKWVGTIMLVIVLPASVTSIWYPVDITMRTITAETSTADDWSLTLAQGGLVFSSIATTKDYSLDDEDYLDVVMPDVSESRTSLRADRWPADEATVQLWFELYTYKYSLVAGHSVSLRAVFVPAWLPLLLIAAPTAWLWRTDRRAKPWQCANCRYDLRGLEGGVCPECGMGVAQAEEH